MMPQTEKSGSDIRASLIRGGGILPPLTEADRERKPSLWLYLASLIATLASLYTMNYSLDQESFGTLIASVAIAGYTVSYYLRMYRQSWQSLTLPLGVCLAVGAYFLASSGNGVQLFVPAEIASDHQRLPQIAILWLTLIGTFTLTTDAALLFLCVPCMTLIALVSTSVIDTPVFYAFVVFVGATTFLMIHENYLRSQTERVLGRTSVKEAGLFRGQVLLAGLCVIGAVMLGEVLAVPMKWVGRALYDSAGVRRMASQVTSSVQRNTALNPVGEQDRLDIATGPVSESDTLLMEVESPVKAYWRGTTFDYYDGQSFQHSFREPITLKPAGMTEPPKVGQFSPGEKMQNDPAQSAVVFMVPLRLEELMPETMKNSRQISQTFHIVSGSFTQVYGAGNIERAKIAAGALIQGKGGGLSLPSTLPLNAQYEVTSRIADENPETLRAASSDLQDMPGAVARMYLGRGADLPELKEYVRKQTQGMKNNYERVMALKTAIARDCKYSLQAPKAPPETDVVLNFLLVSKVGYCDSFAAALTVLCRYANIPARLVTGFLPESAGADGKYPVKDKDKHAWTEVFFPRVGWVAFDATEGSEDISDYSGTQNLAKGGFLGWLKSRGALSGGVLVLVLVLVGILIYNEVLPRLNGKKNVGESVLTTQNFQIMTQYLKITKALARQGFPRESAVTPDEYAALIHQQLRIKSPEFVARFNALTETMNRYRYGQTPADEPTINQAKQEVAELLKLLKSIDLKTKAQTV